MTTAPRNKRTANITVTLTPVEASWLAEAVRASQQAHRENIGRLDPVLSRIQRKLGETPGDE